MKNDAPNTDQDKRAQEERALKEAAERRAKYDKAAESVAGEDGGPDRLEPTRFGDWEKKGLISDF